MPLVLHQSLDEIQEQQRLAAQRQAEAAERAQHWYSGETPTANEVLAQINRIWEVDQQRAQNAFYDFSKLQQDNTSTFYNPYTQATNPAVAALGQLGVVDVSNINDQWFADNAWLKEYFVTSDTSTSAKAPTKKSSMLEKAAYYYNLLDEQRGQTSAAQKEIEDLRRELSYKALDPGKNYSDEDIINHIDMSKYPTLQKMIEGRNKGEPIKLNSAVAYADKDWMLGVLWGARNGGGSGSDMQNQANSALGIGNKWKDNPLITAKMDAGNRDTYSPYELGMTLEEEGLFFGRYSFDQQWIDANYEKIMNGNDPVAKKYLANIINAESQTQEAEGAVAKLNEKIQEWINADYDEKDILDKVEKFKASNPILQKIDDSLYPVDLMGFNRPIQYGKKSMEEYVHVKYWERATAEEGALNFVQGQVDSAIRPDEPEAANNGGSPVEPEVPEAPETPEEERPEPEPGPAPEAQETPAPNSAPVAEPTPTPGPEQKQRNPQKVHKKVELPQAGPTPTPAPDAQRKSVQREQDKNLRAGIGIIDEDATPAEKSQMKSGWTVTWDDMQNMWGTMKSAWENLSRNFLNGLKDTADNGFTSKAFSLMGTINEHEANVDRFTALSAQKDQMERKLGNLIYVGQEIQDENTITIHIGDNEVNLVMARVPTEEHPDGEFVLKAAVNTTTNQNSVMDGDDFYAALGGRQAFEDRISQTVAGFNDHVNRVKAANQMGAFLDEDGRKELEKYYSIKAEYNDLEEKLAKEEEAYQAAKSDYRKAYGAWNRSNLLFGALGVVDEDQAYLLDMMDYAYSFSQTPQTQKYGFSAANMLDESIEFGKYSSDVGEVVNGVPAGLVEKINSDKEKLQENIQDIQFALDYFGENLPEEYRKHMQTEMANYQRNIDDYDYFLLNQKEDWQQMLEEGRKKDSRELAPDSYMSESYLYWRAMTQSEKDRYHYLLGKEGQSAADEYYRFLADEQNGVLPKRSNDDMKAAIAAGIGEDGVLLNLMAIASTPASAIMSGIALLYSGVTGKELSEDNPLMFLNNFANTVNAETTRFISESLKDQPFASALALGAYEILYNRGRSLMNSMAFPGLGMIHEFVGSMPMAVTAMADEVAKLKSAGAEDWQAWLLGGITLLTEAGTESISLGNIKEARELGMSSVEGIKAFLKQYPINGLEEALGESLNTIIEKNADKIVMGDRSEWSQRVWEYMTTRGMDRDTAEAMATKDDIEEVVHTAIISFLSPATDVLSFVGGKLELYNDYRKEARKKKVSVKEIRQNRQNREQMLNALTEAAESREPGRIDYDALGRMYGTAQEQGPAVPRPQNATEIYEQRNDYLSDLEILETATQSNVASVRSSAISKVLNIGTSEVTADRANAAAMGVEDTFANGAADIQDILTGGMVAGTNSTTLKVGIQYAILGGEQSQCRQLVQSEEFRNATPDVQAEMLAQAAVADASNADVQNAVSSAVHDNRVAIEEKKLIAAGEFKPIEPVKQKLSSDMAAARQAQQDLRQRTNEEKAAADALTAANEQFINDPGNDNNVNEMARATADLGDKQESTKQYEQHLEKAQTEQEKTEEEYNSNRSSAVATMREKAIEAVKNIDAQRAEQEEQRRILEEQAAADAKEAERQKLLDDERTGRIDEAIARQKIEALAKQNGLEGKEAEKFVNRLMQYRNDRMMNKIDMSKPFSASEGDVVMRQLEDRFGVKVVLSEMEGKENGKYDPSTNTITLNKNLPAGQILVEFAMHELTHALEQTGAYQKYHDTVLGIMFDTEEKLNKAIATKINKYKEDGKELSIEQAKREIVAEYSRMKLSDRDTVNRLMDEGLGGKIRNFLHNINQFLKNRKLSGNEKTTAENLRRAERAFQMAINERAGSLNRQSPAAQVRADMQTAAENSIGIDVDNMTDAEKEAMLQEAGMDYQSAVDRGDLDAAQQDVEFVAKANGYTDRAYHGSDSFGFTEFDLKAGQGTIFVAYSERISGTYTDNPNVREIGSGVVQVTPLDMSKMNDNEFVDYACEILGEPDDDGYYISTITIDQETTDEIGVPTYKVVFDNILDEGGSNEQTMFRDQLEGMIEGTLRPAQEEEGGVYRLYARPGKQLVVDAHGHNWNDIPFDSRNASLTTDENGVYEYAPDDLDRFDELGLDRPSAKTREIAKWAKANGYDSVRINNVYDNGQYASEREAGHGDIGIFFRKDDVKSADTITRDNDGNVIPLSERFNTENPDIRYATGDHELSEAEMNQALLDAGVITQEEENEQLSPQRQYGTKTLPKVDGVDPRVLEWLADHSDYEPDTNAEQVQRAVNWMMNNRNEADPEGFWNSLEQIERKGFNSLTPDGQARLYVLASAAARKNDVGVQIRINNLINTTGTSIGQALQARKLYRLMTPDGRKMVLQDEVNKINRDLKNEGKEGNVTLSDWLLRAAGDAQTEEEFAQVRAKFEEEMARQLPSTWKEKLRTWRMTSMLANPRTHARNFVGNLLFVPVVGLKNVVGQQLESAAAKRGFFGHALTERTKSFSHTADAEDFAAKDAKIMKDTLTGEAKYSPESRIEQYKKSFGRGQGILSRTIGKGVQSLADFNSWALEKEDWIFLNRHYQNAMAGYMTANNLTSDKMKGKTLEKARSYAILEAQKATYRDANAASTWLNQMSKRGGIGGFLVDTVLPFKKTPANVLRRGIEYSPIGLISSFASAKKSLDLYAAWEANGKQGDMPKGAKTVNEVLDGIAAGLTGTGIAALGALGYALGAVKLGFDKDDDKDAIEKADGHQEYSIELFGHSFTFDWAAPVCMPFFTGASLFKNLSENNLNFDLGSFLNAFAGISEPVFNLSMLDGVNTLLKTASYSQSGLPIGDIIQKIGANYIGSIIGPAALGAFARTVDQTSRRSYAESGDQASIWTMMLEQAQNKYPFLSMLNTPYRDMWGNEESQGWLEAALENFILPGYHKEIKNDPVNDELMRVYEAMHGEVSVTPSSAAKKLGGEVLTDKEQDQYAARRGQIAYELLSDLFSRPDYLALTELNPEAQADMIGNIYKYANAAARKELQPDYELTGWMKNGYESGSPIDSLFASKEKKAQDQEVKSHKLDLFGSILMNDSDGIPVHVEGLKRAGKSNSYIRDMLTEEFKPKYIEAYIASLNGDLEARETMEQIAACLKLVDIGDSSYTDKDLEKWLKGIGDNTSGSLNPNNMLGNMMTTLDTGGGRGNRELMWQSMYNNTAGNEYGLGNIDLNNRQVVWNPDGTFSTEQSFSVNIDGKEVLLPTVIDGRIVSEDEAIEHYYRTGEYLGRFNTVEEAEEYARRLHQRQEWYYSR